MVGPILFDLINQPIVSRISSHVALDVHVGGARLQK